MKKLLIATMFAVACSGASAATTSTKSAYETAKKEAKARYADDRKICADEQTSSIRMQCLRDAKAEYDKALADAKAAQSAAAKTPAAESKSAASAKAPAVCNECGRVTAVTTVEKKGEGGPIGMIAGGVAGAVLGHQIGGGRGQDVATVAGAAGGAYAGHKVEERLRTKTIWQVSVHMENGDDRTFEFEKDPGFAKGDAVKLSGNSIVRP